MSAGKEGVRHRKQAKSGGAKAAGSDDVHRFILEKCHTLYTQKEMGLENMCKVLGLSTLIPREKITTLIIGNHSAGKSSFVNWYVGEKIMKESMAMETSGFAFVVSGSKRDTFKGKATCRYVKCLEGVEKFDGVMSHLSTEVSVSDQRDFTFCDFVDSPGLSDGHLQYAFPVNDVIEWLAQRVDLVFVFFDPHGQATCERTMDVVRKLNASCKNKLHYFLTKADDIRTEPERLKLISQLSQSLSRVVAADSPSYYGEHALEVKSIYRPHETNGEEKEEEDFNQIGEVCELIHNTVKQHVQKHCEDLESRCGEIIRAIDKELVTYENGTKRNFRLWATIWGLTILTWVLPLLQLCYLLTFAKNILLPEAVSENQYVDYVFQAAKFGAAPMEMLDNQSNRLNLVAGLFGVFLVAMAFSRLLHRAKLKLRTAEEIESFRQWKPYVKKLLEKDGVSDQLWNRLLSTVGGTR